MKLTNSTPFFPVVIVGKDRTRMTCAVIDHIKKHMKNAKPFFVCVSDRSREGHDEVIRQHLRNIGEINFEVLKTKPENDRYGWGAAINIGLEWAFGFGYGFTNALVVDNDWLLQQDLDMEKYAYATSECGIGAVTFKPVNRGTNVTLEERTFPDIGTFLYRSKGEDPRYSFTAEIGCMFISKRMVEAYGQFKENCTTDETEWTFCDWYNKLSEDKKEDNGLWFATDKALYHENLNGDGHVFTHVGLHSQHDGPHKWEVPEQYLYLSDEEGDAKLCDDEHWIDADTFEERGGGSCENFWKSHRVLFATNNNLSTKNPLFESYELVRRFSPEDIYVAPVENFGGEVFPAMFDFGLSNGYDYIVYFDADCFILSEENLKREFARFAQNPRNIFGGMPDGDACTTRGQNPVCINPFLMFVNLRRAAKYRKAAGFYDFGNIDESLTCEELIRQNTTLKESLEWNCADTDGYAKKHGAYRNKFGYENYHTLLCGYKVFRENEVYYTKASDFKCDADERGITTAIWTFDTDCPRREICSIADANESGLICIHTWYARMVLDTPLEYCDEQWTDFNKKRILTVLQWVKRITSSGKKNMESDNKTIDWGCYFDRIFCLHYLPQGNKKKRLVEELNRVGILNSGIFEFRYTSPTRYDKLIFETEKDAMRCPSVAFVNICLEVRRILAESLALGYKRILLMENDVAFLKDLGMCKEMLDAMPTDVDLVQFDKFVNDGWIKTKYDELKNDDTKVVNEWYYNPEGIELTSAACFALNVTGMRKMLDLMEEHIIATDGAFPRMGATRVVAKKNLAIQIFAEGSWSVGCDGIDYMHKVYQNADVDYDEYNLPFGYGYGKVYDAQSETVAHAQKKGRKFVSVYAIAKDEEPVAERWFECVKEADEVCVLDTGSTDNTVKILRDLGAKVEVKTYDEWSFAVARNDSMKLVSPESEILFTLDLDETIAPGWRKKLEDAWIAEEEKGNKPAGVLYKYIWSFYPDGTEAQSFSVRKVHANGQGKWKYRCHELLTEVNGYTFFLDGFVVEHHQNRKTNRSTYLPLLEKDARENPNDDRSAYYYARELMYCERWHEAIQEFKRHLELSSAGWTCERASSMRNIAFCYKQLKSDGKCELWLWKSAEEDPTNREATFRLGEMAMERKDYRTAVKVLKRCLDIEKPSLEYISDPTVWSARPAFLYAQSLWWTGRWDEAVEMSKKALEIEPNNKAVQSQYEGMKNTRDAARNGNQ